MFFSKEKLKKIRKEKKITQNQLASLIGKTRLTIARYENGEIIPSEKIIEKIAQVLGVDIIELSDTCYIKPQVWNGVWHGLNEENDKIENLELFKLIQNVILKEKIIEEKKKLLNKYVENFFDDKFLPILESLLDEKISIEKRKEISERIKNYLYILLIEYTT